METLSSTEIKNIKTITEKWENSDKRYCGRCIERAIDHFDKQHSQYVNCDDELDHYTRHDITDILGDSGNDIHILLEIIGKLTK